MGTFVAETHALSTADPISLTVPAGVQGQDVMTVFVAINDQVQSITPGWTQLDSESSTPTFLALRKVAAGAAGSASSDVGSTLTVAGFIAAKSAAVMVVERGVDVNDAPPVHNFRLYTGIAAGTTSFAGPAVTTTVDGSEILSVFMDKDSLATTLTAAQPSGYTTRSSAIPTSGTGKMSAVAATKTSSTAGNYGADTWVLNGTPGTVGIFTLALKPAVTTQTVFPTSDVAATAVTGVGDATNMYANIDESTLSLTDYDEFLQSSDLTVGLSSLTDPGVDTGFVVFYTLGRGATTTSVGWTITLKQGTTTIESWTETVTGDGVSLTHSVSSTNAANIVFTAGVAANLRLEFAATTVA